MRNVLSPVLLLLVTSSLCLGSAGAQSTYYLALGDSLAIGIQPSPHGNVPTNQGYADDLYRVFRAHIPGLRFMKLGCSGETTTTMLPVGPGGRFHRDASCELHYSRHWSERH
jgi:hypothetical protein